jgi:paraquat-inducible protein B
MGRANPKLIGGFVLGAIVLAIVGLIFFSKGGFFAQREHYILYFDRSVKGLSVGAPVTFRGVRIGAVTDISVHVRPTDYTFKIPVAIEIDPKRIEQIKNNGEIAEKLIRFGTEDTLQDLIGAGLRGQLQLQSLITGQLFVQLDIHPGTDVVLSGYQGPYPEIPTIPSGLDELSRTFENLPVQEVADKLMSTLSGLESLVHNPDLPASLNKLNHGLDELRLLLAKIDRGVDPALQQFNSAATAVRKSADNVAERVAGMTSRSQSSFDRLDQTLAQAGTTLQKAETILQENDELGGQLHLTLQELQRTARSLRLLTDALESHPDMLVRGKGKEEVKP